jgi:hypothetical protein
MDAREKPLSMILVKRVAIFMFVICSVSFIYWVIGSFGSFLDGTQAMLLGLIRLSSLGIVVFSSLGALLSVCYAAARRYRLRVMGFLGYLAVTALGVSALFLSQSVILLSQGLR